MKKLMFLFSLIAVIACLTTVDTSAQRWPFGDANRVTITPTNDTIVITSLLKRGINYYSYSTDTATVVQATNLSSELKTGDQVYFEVTNGGKGGDAETFTPSTGFTGAAVSIASGKTQIIGFIYNGTALKKFLSTQTD